MFFSSGQARSRPVCLREVIRSKSAKAMLKMRMRLMLGSLAGQLGSDLALQLTFIVSIR